MPDDPCATAAQPIRCDHGKAAMEFCRRCDPLALPSWKRLRSLWRSWRTRHVDWGL